ncbi:beta-glucan synthesis-associated [Sphaerosporella brunnea]|uniref:Beta-glucan synthesis-associated n=1 Tax=Sphaerosporella brunnea TaxID=1250544 RepID=A0A5J5EF04_9PEZI|nr:beta-glucan synthesis-associated [Sphaerosporella brunnea]
MSPPLVTPNANSRDLDEVINPFSVYQNSSPVESSELLVPPLPPGSRFQPYSDSPLSSRRSSWSIDGYGNNARYGGPFVSYDVSGASSRVASPGPMEPLSMQMITEKLNISPSSNLLLYPNEKEADDALHDPATGMDNDRECDIWTKRGLLNIGGLGLITLGIMVLFIGYPILTFVREAVASKEKPACTLGELCLDVGPRPLLKNFRTSLIDSDTPDSAKTRTSADGKQLKLVFSDEFNQDNRSFYPGEDPYWEAVDIYYAATVDLEWYDPDAITTKDGYLEIEFAAIKNHNLDYRSGMLQSWNKMCFKGGLLEASISLPGRGDVSGLWPGFWTMGNLGRPGYLASTEGMWPYSYNDGCDAGITANQSSADGISFLPGMKLPGCTCEGEDHPNRGKARSAPEIDAVEATVGKASDGSSIGLVSQSAQMAPFDPWYQPNYDFMELYNPEITSMNSYRGGSFQQAISGLSTLNNDWYDGKAYQRYGFEYIPGDKGHIVWSIGDLKTWKMTADATGANGNIGPRPIPVEPMTVILNCGMSPSFALIEYDKLAQLFPAKMRIDWVRIWQDPDCEDCSVTCDPPDYPTTSYIEKHKDAYMNPNLTNWKDTGFDWPKNSLVDNCQ